MASEASLQGLLEELTCSICLDLFQDPVLIPECGHNFCRGCLTRSWGVSESEASCPQCRQTFGIRSLLPIRHLVRMVEEARRCRGHLGEEGGSFCPKHREPLKLFCKDHETLICVVCDRSKEHRGHSVIPTEEAFQEYQIKVEDSLKSRKEQKEKIATYKRDTEQTVQERLDIGSILKKYQAKETYENPVDLLVEPKWTIWDYSDIPALLKRVMKKLRDTLENGLQLQEVNVTLDADTAHPDCLDVSKDQKSVKGFNPLKKTYCVRNPMRFVYHHYVLGCQKFSTGRHFWEVIVGDKGGWAVGVANKPVNLISLDEQTRYWELQKWRGKYTAVTPSKGYNLILTEEPTRIRISLNCEGGQVSFFDASTATLLHSFSDASLVGETLLPSFCLGEGTCMTLP